MDCRIPDKFKVTVYERITKTVVQIHMCTAHSNSEAEEKARKFHPEYKEMDFYYHARRS